MLPSDQAQRTGGARKTAKRITDYSMKKSDEKKRAGHLTKGVLFVAGTIFLGLGILGIVLPLLPTTPFLLLAAACYARSSTRFHKWLLNNRWFGSYIKNYLEGKGIPLKVKVLSISLLWATIGYAAAFVVSTLLLRIILILIAIGVTIHILSTRTLKKKKHYVVPTGNNRR